MATRRKQTEQRTKYEERNKYIDEIFPDRIRTLLEREAANGIKYSTASLGKKLGITRQAIAAWLNGRTAPPFNALIELSNLYDVSTDWILGIPNATESREPDIQNAARVLGVEQVETVHAIKTIFTALSESSPHHLPCKEIQPLVEAVIQSDSFRNMFDGYVAFINYFDNEYLAVQEFAQKPVTELSPESFESTPYYAHSFITLNAYKAAEDIKDKIRDYSSKRTLPKAIKPNKKGRPF